jgi:hypothetical protein
VAHKLKQVARPADCAVRHSSNSPSPTQLSGIIADASANDAQHFLEQKSRDLLFLADVCITHARAHQLNLILALTDLHPTVSSRTIISCAQPPLLHRAALLPSFSPSVVCTVLAHVDDVNIADDTGKRVLYLVFRRIIRILLQGIRHWRVFALKDWRSLLFSSSTSSEQMYASAIASVRVPCTWHVPVGM